MKKNRNSFFQENSTNFQSFNPYNQMGQYQMNYNAMGYQNTNMMPEMATDINERLARIERNINRLDRRLTKLESSKIETSTQIEESSTNMYML